MKKTISIFTCLMIAVAVFATGNEGVNPPQSGVIIPTSATPNITNTFAYPFQSVPLVIIYSSLTNGTPITNNFVTTTNFGFSFPTPGTNSSFAWQAFVGGTKMDFGANTNIAAASTTIPFHFTYASPPVVVVTAQGGTNAVNAVTVTSVTITNFVLLANASQTNYWQAIGTVYNPQSPYTGQFPRDNTLLVP